MSDGYATLLDKASVDEEPLDISALVKNGETLGQEFKSTLRMNLHTRQHDSKIELSCLKTIAGFLNHSGGRLIVGVSDDGTPVGVAEDGFPNEDKMHQHLVNLMKDRLGAPMMMFVHARFDAVEEARVLVVDCAPGKTPVFVKDGNAERFFVRSGVTTLELGGNDAQSYIKQRFGR